jgi:hypothetical protein
MSIVINDYDGDESYYDERHGSYIVWLGKKGNRETNKMHELAHIRHGTDTSKAKELVIRLGEESGLLDDDNIEIIADLFFATWNVLEDERVESFEYVENENFQYKRPRPLFRQHKKDMGKTKTKTIAESNPVEALICARFNRDDLVGKDVKEYIVKSRKVNKEEVYKLAEDYIKKYLFEYVRNV